MEGPGVGATWGKMG